MQVHWTNNAIEEYNKIIDYLKQNLEDKRINDFNYLLKNTIKFISKNPDSSKLYNENIRYRNIVSTIYLYYIIEKKNIYLITIFNQKRNPEILKSLLS